MTALISFVNAFFSSLQTQLKWILDGFLWIFKTVLYVIIDGLLTVVVGVVQAIDVSSLVSSAALNWGNVPSQLIYCVNQCGIPQGLAIITGAIVIRMILNLIPAAFTRI